MTRAVFLLFILLAACAPSPVDPFYMIQAGQELQSAGNAAIQATQQARHEQVQQIAMAATGTADAQAAQATSQALEAEKASYHATASADAQAAQVAQVTARAAEAQATQAAYLSSLSLSATQTTTAIGLETERQAAEREQQMAEFRAWLIRSALFCLVAAIIIYLVYTLWRLRYAINDWIDWRIEWLDRRNRLFETRSGTVQVTPNGDGTYTIQLVSSRPPPPNLRHFDIHSRSDAGQVQALTSSGSVLISPLARSQPDGVTIMALKFVRDAVRNGWTGDQLPGWREADWTSEKWQRVVAALKSVGVVETGSNGTFLTERYECTVDLLNDLERGDLRVRPGPA
jgi:hypothetical protein